MKFIKSQCEANVPDISGLVAQLDEDAFQRREQAQQALIRMGSVIGPAVAKAMTSTNSAEARARLRRVLSVLREQAFTGGDPDAFRFPRA